MADLIDLWHSAIQGKELSKDSLNFIASELSSPNLEREVAANSIMFIVGEPAARSAALNRFNCICKESRYRENSKAAILLLVVLARLSKQQFQENMCIITYAYEAAIDPIVSVRINAVHVLRQLAKFGDQKAVQLLKNSVNDPDSYVSQAAQIALTLADGHRQ